MQFLSILLWILNRSYTWLNGCVNEMPQLLAELSIVTELPYCVNNLYFSNLLQEDEKFLSELFAQLTDEGTDEQKRRDLVLFLKEFCNFSQNLQPQGKESFYKVHSFILSDSELVDLHT
jgi:Component of IIS longevity pathway SMK-1.